MLFDASTSTVSNDKALLVSATQTDDSGKGCLQFYYNAYGNNF